MNMLLEKYKGFRRLYPRLRFSWTTFYKYLRNDWLGMWDYLTNNEQTPTFKMRRGKEIHEILENLPMEKTIADYLAVEVKDFKKEGKLELKVEHVIPTTLVGVLDLVVRTDHGDIIVDYKTGSSSLSGYKKQLMFYSIVAERKNYNPTFGMLLKIDDKFEIKDMMFIEFTKRLMHNFEEEIYTAINEIALRITEGALDNYISSNNLLSN